MSRVIRSDRAGEALIPAAVADARERASALLAQTEREIAQRAESALAAARAQARAELAAELLALAEARDRMLAAESAQLAQLGLALARRIVGEELALRPERVRDLCAELLARVRRARQVSLRVHPDDRALLETQLAALRASAELAGALHIESDPALARGDCVVVSDVGVLDARIDTRLEALGRALGRR